MLLLWTICLQCYAVTVQHAPVHMTLDQKHLTSATHVNISSKSTAKQHQTSLMQDERSLLVKRDSREVLESEKKKKKKSKKKKKKATPFDCWDIVKDRVFAKKKKKDDDDEYTCLQYPTPFFSKKKCCQYCPFKNPFWPADKCKTKNPALAGGAKIDYFTSTGAATRCDAAKLVVSIGLNDLDDGADMVVSTWNPSATGGAAPTGGTCYAITFTQGTGTTAIDGITGGGQPNILPASLIAECDKWGGSHLKFYQGTTCTTGDTLLGADDATLDSPGAITCQELHPAVQFSAGGTNTVDADQVQKNFNAAGCVTGDAKIEWFLTNTCDSGATTDNPFWYVNLKKSGGTAYWKSNTPLQVKTGTNRPCYSLYAPKIADDIISYGAAGEVAFVPTRDASTGAFSIDDSTGAAPLVGTATASVVTITSIGGTGAGFATGGIAVSGKTAGGQFQWDPDNHLSLDCACSPATAGEQFNNGVNTRCQLHPGTACAGDRAGGAPYVSDVSWQAAASADTQVFGNLGWCDASGCYGLAGATTMGACQVGSTIATGNAGHTLGYGPTAFLVTAAGVGDETGSPAAIWAHGFRKTFKTAKCAR